MPNPRLVPALATVLVLAAGGTFAAPAPKSPAPAVDPIGRVTRSDAEWRARLSPEGYRVLRKEGTERAFTGKLLNEHRAGTYACAGCGLELFSSKTKFESGTGWPSFWAPLAKTRVREVPDSSYGIPQTEIECARCGGHLGHVFDDGPRPTGLRYCMNSAALTFAVRPRP